MELTVLSADASTSEVQCETWMGPLLVVWRGATMPEVGRVVDVELNAAGELGWGVDVTLVTDTTFEPVVGALVGTIEQTDGHGAALRSNASIVLIEWDGTPPHSALGQHVSVRPARWEAWPTGV